MLVHERIAFDNTSHADQPHDRFFRAKDTGNARVLHRHLQRLFTSRAGSVSEAIRQHGSVHGSVVDLPLGSGPSRMTDSRARIYTGRFGWALVSGRHIACRELCTEGRSS